MTGKLKKRDLVSISAIVISVLGLVFIYQKYQVNECMNVKIQALNKIIEGYPEITSPVLKNRIDKQYNIQVKELNDLKKSNFVEQIKQCGKRS